MPNPAWPKPVVFTVDLCPNYLWHILAVARIAYDSEYAERFRATVDRSDLEFLESCRPLLVWGENEGGPLAGFFSTLPAWLGLNDRAHFQRYFNALAVVLRNGSLQPLVKEFADASWDDRFIIAYLNQENFATALAPLQPTVSRLAAIYLRNLDPYGESVWPQVRPELERRAGLLQEAFATRDYIASWEVMLKQPFAADAFRIVLCYASKNGPDYNSLGYGSLLIYYDKSTARTCQFVSHEIGTHMLNEHYLSLAHEGRYERRALFKAYETLAVFYNRRVLGVDELKYSLPRLDDARHLAVYEAAYREGVDPRDLLRHALGLPGAGHVT